MVRIPKPPHRPPVRPPRLGLEVRGGRGAPGPGLAGSPTPTVRPHTVGQVVLLEASGPLSDVVEELDRAACFALARGPRGVVVDLSGVAEAHAPGALRRLAWNGRHPRDWPGIPMAIAGLYPRDHEKLRAMPLGGHLTVTASVGEALALLLQTLRPAVESLRLAPHPTAARAARQFVNRTLLDWNMSPCIPAASLVLSELVSNAVAHTRTDVDLTVSGHGQAVRVAVRDRSLRFPLDRPAGSLAAGPGLPMVAQLASACGVLPCAEGGGVVWAVLNPCPQSA